MRVNRHKNQKEVPIVRILVVAVACLLLLAFVFQFVSMQRRLNAIEERGSGKTAEVAKNEQGSSSEVKLLKSKIEEL